MSAQQARRKTPLTRDRVITVAVRMADADGVDSLSMRKLAAVLKVEAMSLYNHVQGKDDLLDAMVEYVVGQFLLPDTQGEWRQELRSRAQVNYQVLLKHPWATLLLFSRINTSSTMLLYSNANIGCLVEGGFSYALADHAINAIDNHVYGFTLQRSNAPVKPKDYAQAARRNLPMIPSNDYPYLHGLASQIADGRHDGINDFSFGLEMILAGLQAKLEGETSAGIGV